MLRRINLRTWYAIHRWSSIVTGVFILIWLVSGIFMTAGALFPVSSETAQPSPEPDYAQLHLRPAEAVAVLEDKSNTTEMVTQMSLLQIGDKVAYQIVTGDRSHLVDAVSGEELILTEHAAREIVHSTFGADAEITEVYFRQAHSLSYLYGPLPAFDFYLANEDDSHVAVSADDGTVSILSRTQRFLALMEHFHTFEIIAIVTTGHSRLAATLLWITIMASALTSLVGYYLALPIRWIQGKRSARTEAI